MDMLGNMLLTAYHRQGFSISKYHQVDLSIFQFQNFLWSTLGITCLLVSSQVSKQTNGKMESYTQEVYSGMFSATTSVRECKNQDWEKVNYNGIVVNLQLIPWGN